jgi:hypothetical protein
MACVFASISLRGVAHAIASTPTGDPSRRIGSKSAETMPVARTTSGETPACLVTSAMKTRRPAVNAAMLAAGCTERSSSAAIGTPADPVISKPSPLGSTTVAIVASVLATTTEHTSPRASVPSDTSRARLAIAEKARCISSISCERLRASIAWRRCSETVVFTIAPTT